MIPHPNPKTLLLTTTTLIIPILIIPIINNNHPIVNAAPPKSSISSSSIPIHAILNNKGGALTIVTPEDEYDERFAFGGSASGSGSTSGTNNYHRNRDMLDDRTNGMFRMDEDDGYDDESLPSLHMIYDSYEYDHDDYGDDDDDGARLAGDEEKLFSDDDDDDADASMRDDDGGDGRVDYRSKGGEQWWKDPLGQFEDYKPFPSDDYNIQNNEKEEMEEEEADGGTAVMLQDDSYYDYDDDDYDVRRGDGEGMRSMRDDLVKDDDDDLVIGNYDLDDEDEYDADEMYEYDNNNDDEPQIEEEEDDGKLPFDIRQRLAEQSIVPSDNNNHNNDAISPNHHPPQESKTINDDNSGIIPSSTTTTTTLPPSPQSSQSTHRRHHKPQQRRQTKSTIIKRTTTTPSPRSSLPIPLSVMTLLPKISPLLTLSSPPSPIRLAATVVLGRLVMHFCSSNSPLWSFLSPSAASSRGGKNGRIGIRWDDDGNDGGRGVGDGEGGRDDDDDDVDMDVDDDEVQVGELGFGRPRPVRRPSSSSSSSSYLEEKNYNKQQRRNNDGIYDFGAEEEEEEEEKYQQQQQKEVMMGGYNFINRSSLRRGQTTAAAAATPYSSDSITDDIDTLSSSSSSSGDPKRRGLFQRLRQDPPEEHQPEGRKSMGWRRNRKNTMRKEMEHLQERLDRMVEAMKVGESTLDRLRLDRDERCREVEEVHRQLSSLEKTNGYLKSQLRENRRELDRTVETERHRAYEELARVRSSMAAVLDRERRMMRAQIVKATREVRTLIMDDGDGGGVVGRKEGVYGHVGDDGDGFVNVVDGDDDDDNDDDDADVDDDYDDDDDEMTDGVVVGDYDDDSGDSGDEYRY